MEICLFVGRADENVKSQLVHVMCMTSILVSTSIQYHLLLLSLGMSTEAGRRLDSAIRTQCATGIHDRLSSLPGVQGFNPRNHKQSESSIHIAPK